MATTIISTTLTLGDRLTRARKHADMSQAELAAAVGISRVSVSHYENDARLPSFQTVCDWARATNVALAFFADATITDGEAVTSTWERALNSQVGSAEIDLTRPFPHAVPVECDGQFQLPLADSRTYVLNSEHALLDRAA